MRDEGRGVGRTSGRAVRVGEGQPGPDCLVPMGRTMYQWVELCIHTYPHYIYIYIYTLRGAGASLNSMSVAGGGSLETIYESCETIYKSL